MKKRINKTFDFKDSVHSFYVEDAIAYGAECAVILFNMRFWIEKNEANNQHFYKGRFWTFNSVQAFQKLFPYLTAKQIRTRLKKLVNAGVLIEGKFNKKNYDKTTWYAFKANNSLICPNGQMDVPIRANGCAHTGKPIPDINTDSIYIQIEARKTEFKKRVLEYNTKYDTKTLKDFFEYWTEHDNKGSKMRFEKEKTFGIGQRLSRWKTYPQPQLKTDRL